MFYAMGFKKKKKKLIEDATAFLLQTKCVIYAL